jgi:hypothetical protein
MAMILEKGKVCPYAKSCPYNISLTGEANCFGARENRDTEFICEFVVDGKIVENVGARLPQDKTGKMKILVE